MAELGATARFDVEEAPDELAVVQDLLNTAQVGRFADLLGEVETASGWPATAGLTAARLAEADLAALRAFRDDLRRLSRGESGASWSGGAALELGADGAVELKASGAGAAYVISKVLAVVFEAQQADTWRRLKTCRNDACQVAFYDRSRNNSGVWHNVKTCGNQANLRAHRERNR